MDKPKQKTRLQELRERFAPPKSKADQALDDYLYDYRGTKNLANLITEVGRTHPHPDIAALGEVLTWCRPKCRCRLSVCPTCSKTPRKKERQGLWQAVIDHVGFVPPISDISYVTVNGSPLPDLDEEEIIIARDRFRKSLRDTLERRLSITAWAGHLDVGDSQDGAIHAHLIIHHPGITQDALRGQLEAVYNGDRAVDVAEWYATPDRLWLKTKTDISEGRLTLNEANMSNVTAYLCKALPKVKMESYVDSEGEVKYRLADGLDTARLLAERLLKLVHIRQRGFQGSRIRLGLKKINDVEWKGHRRITRDKNTIIRIEEFRIVALAGGYKRNSKDSYTSEIKDKLDSYKVDQSKKPSHDTKLKLHKRE